MNREIIFRGKRVDNGEWVFGSYNRIVGDAEIMTRFDVTDNRNHEFKNVAFDIHLITETVLPDSQGWDYSGCFRYHKVDPSTIGQFTGLTDSKGNKVFEGDILIYIATHMSDMEVKFENGCFVGEGPFDTHPLSTYLSSGDFESIEVIGSIHDTHLTQQS